MPATRTLFFCTECGNESARWAGQCPACQAWNTLAQAPAPARGKRGPTLRAGAAAPARLGEGPSAPRSRRRTGIAELDLVLGGGLVAGSVVLLGGEPGVGKSTLLLQAAAALTSDSGPVLYVSGEESAEQVALRAERLGPGTRDVLFLAETDADAVVAAALSESPSIILIDSIQTMRVDDVDGTAGNVGQVRECAARLQRYAKSTGAAVVLVGHVTKDGAVAGPRTLEHMVDVVLYFEGTRGAEHRILRAAKNRFGSAQEVGLFTMTGAGLVAVEDPSEVLLSNRSRSAPGAAVTVTMEGTRPLLVEVQALCAESTFGSPQRVSTGVDARRLAMLLAVLEKGTGVTFGRQDVFLNVTGGVRLGETAADLAVCTAILSSARGRPVAHDTVVLGEVGLTGELRPVPGLARRLAEAARLGFERALIPDAAEDPGPSADRLRVTRLPDIGAIAEVAFA